MEDKKMLKIKLSTAILLAIVVIILVVALGIAIYKLNVNNKIENESDINAKSLEESNVSAENTEVALQQNKVVQENTSVMTEDKSNTKNNNIEKSINEVSIGKISFSIPTDWIENKKFIVDVTRINEHEIYTVYSPSNMEKTGGNVFSINVVDKNYDYKDLPECKVIKSNEKYNILLLRPSDVQFGDDIQEYKELENDMDKIISTIKFNNSNTISLGKISFEIPENWIKNGTFKLRYSSEKTYNYEYYTLYSPSNMEKTGGKVFGFIVADKNKEFYYKEDFPVIKSNTDYEVRLNRPFDVQYEENEQEYKILESGKDEIISTIRFN